MEPVPFFEQLSARAREIDSLLCVGLDPHPQDLAKIEGAADMAEASITFCTAIIEATKDVAVAYKPNAAFFEALGAKGAEALEKVVAAVPEGILVLLDAKRGDIGSTAAAYATAAFVATKAHAITGSPYMGSDSLEPLLADATKGCFILCKTSNPGSNDLQTLAVSGGESVGPSLFEEVARLTQTKWNAKGNAGLVVGATDTDALARTRAAAPDIWILAPGVGFQGGDLVGTVRCALRKDGLGLLVPVSRGISRDADPKAAAHKLRDELNAARAEAMAGPAVGLPGPSRLAPYQAEFCNLALANDVLRFGSFTLKSGRTSPYFFNAGNFKTGGALASVGRFYAQAVVASGIDFDVLFGPAYKGIPLVAAVGIAMYTVAGRDVDYAYNRKEPKDHGEGGLLVGAKVEAKKCLIVDDVITAGTAIREACGILGDAAAVPCGVVIALDRQEVTGAATTAEGKPMSAVEQVVTELGIPVFSIVSLTDLLEWARCRPDMGEHLEAIRAYRVKYGSVAES